MKERTSVLLAPALLNRLRERARRRGTTLTREIEAAVARYLEDDDANAGLRSLVALGERTQPWPAVDSDESDSAFEADIEHDAFSYGNRA